jgi:hypothetical protein
MTLFSSVNGIRVVSGELSIPLVGMWTADLQLATSDAVTGSATVVVGNLTLMGSVYRSDTYGGQTRCRLIAGAGGWRSPVGRQGYGSPSGVNLSSVLSDVASAAGETMGPLPSGSVGPFYTRAATIASDVLWQLVAAQAIPSWYVDPTGTTRVAAWPSSPVQTPWELVDQKPDEGVCSIATEDYAAWMPGVTFSNPLLSTPQTCAGVTFLWTPDGQFRLDVLTGTAGDRLLGDLEAIIDRQVAPTRWYGRYEYTIENPTTSTVDATPVDPSIGLPDLQGVPLVGSSVATYAPPSGSTCHVQFLNGDPSRPVCVWTVMTPTMASILGGSNPVARLGDQVQSFLPPALPFVGVSAAGPVTGTITVTAPVDGVITQGSQQVTSA